MIKSLNADKLSLWGKKACFLPVFISFEGSNCNSYKLCLALHRITKNETWLKGLSTHAGTWIMDRAVIEIIGNSFRNSCMIDMSDKCYVWFFKDFYLMWTNFKAFIEFVTIWLLFYVLVLWPWDMWNLGSLTPLPTLHIRKWSLNHWTTRRVPSPISLIIMAVKSNTWGA